MAGGDRHRADAALVAAIASGATVADAASLAGVSERTVRRRLSNPAFCGELSRARSAMLESTIGILADASTEAARTLRGLLAANVAPNVRLRAAMAVIDLTRELTEERDLEERVTRLELALEPDASASWLPRP